MNHVYSAKLTLKIGDSIIETTLIKTPPINAQKLLGHDNFYSDWYTEGLDLHKAPIHVYQIKTPNELQYAMVVGRPMNGHDINMCWYAAAPNKVRRLNTPDILGDSDYIKGDERLMRIHEQDLGDAWKIFGQQGYRMLGIIRAESPVHTDNEWGSTGVFLLPVPVWTNSDGERRYQFSPPEFEEYRIIADDHALLIKDQKDRSTLNQVLGVQAIAALSPEITGQGREPVEDEEHWPRYLETPHGSYNQFMGPLQVAVAALFTPKEWKHLGKPGRFSLVYADILGAAEDYVRHHGRRYGDELDVFQRYFVMPAIPFSRISKIISRTVSIPTINVSNPMKLLLNHQPKTRRNKKKKECAKKISKAEKQT